MKLFLMLSFLCINCAKAQEIELIQPLNFGNIVVAHNNSIGFINLNEYGQISTSDNIHTITQGDVGIFELTDFYKHVKLRIIPHIIQQRSIPKKFSNEVFNLTEINVAETIYTEGDGSALIPFGAKLTTSGSGKNHFTDTTYTHQIKLVLQY